MHLKDRSVGSTHGKKACLLQNSTEARLNQQPTCSWKNIGGGDAGVAAEPLQMRQVTNCELGDLRWSGSVGVGGERA